MTVRELIEELSKLDQNLEVRILIAGNFDQGNFENEVLSVDVEQKWDMITRDYLPPKYAVIS